MIINENIKTIYNRAVFLRNAIEQQTKELDELKKTLNQICGVDQKIENLDGTLLYEWKMYNGAERLDAKLLKKDLPEVYEKYKIIGEPSPRSFIKSRTEI